MGRPLQVGGLIHTGQTSTILEFLQEHVSKDKCKVYSSWWVERQTWSATKKDEVVGKDKCWWVLTTRWQTCQVGVCHMVTHWKIHTLIFAGINKMCFLDSGPSSFLRNELLYFLHKQKHLHRGTLNFQQNMKTHKSSVLHQCLHQVSDSNHQTENPFLLRVQIILSVSSSKATAHNGQQLAGESPTPEVTIWQRDRENRSDSHFTITQSTKPVVRKTDRKQFNSFYL